MSASDYFERLIARVKRGEPNSVCSICSAHPIVLEAAMELYKSCGKTLLIEATANQVNQFGGYTDMRPADFTAYVRGIAARVGFDAHRLIIGGDHLGPLVWAAEREQEAMHKAHGLILEYVKAGFEKIHIDTSMRLGSDDPAQKLDIGVIARRAAALCATAEAAGADVKPVYVIGSEVPIPGGAQENEHELNVTHVEDVASTLDAFERAFRQQNLEDAWKRVIAVVVQPGVEFSDNSVVCYDSQKAQPLVRYMKTVPHIVLEGHSTDYQPADLLSRMAADGIAIQKVGPALTFALREGLFALEHIERELLEGVPSLSEFSDKLEQAMLFDPLHWNRYYSGTPMQMHMARRFSLSDRSRYYLGDIHVSAAMNKLLSNLQDVDIPLGLISQYFSNQFEAVEIGELEARAYLLVKERIITEIRKYQTPEMNG